MYYTFADRFPDITKLKNTSDWIGLRQTNFKLPHLQRDNYFIQLFGLEAPHVKRKQGRTIYHKSIYFLTWLLSSGPNTPLHFLTCVCVRSVLCCQLNWRQMNVSVYMHNNADLLSGAVRLNNAFWLRGRRPLGLIYCSCNNGRASGESLVTKYRTVVTLYNYTNPDDVGKHLCNATYDEVEQALNIHIVMPNMVSGFFCMSFYLWPWCKNTFLLNDRVYNSGAVLELLK